MRDEARCVRVLVIAGTLVLLGCDTTAPPTDLPSTLAPNAGNAQTIGAGTAVTTPPSVKVTTGKGNAAAGVAVMFAVASGGGSITGAMAATDANGIATVGSWTLGSLPGANTLTATASGLAGSPLTFTATGIAGAPATITISSGGNQTASVDASVTAPSVVVKDAAGNVLGGIPVTFAVSNGSGTATGLSQTTDAQGVATVGGWILGPTPTVNSLQVTAGAASLTVNATATWVRRIKANLVSACAFQAGASVKCWGENGNANREFGIDPAVRTSSATPVAVSVLPATIVEIGSGTGSHTCGIRSDNSAICWGRSTHGQLGDGSTVSATNAVTVAGGISWAQVATGRLSTCGVSITGVAYCWGTNQAGEIGVSALPLSPAGIPSPIAVEGGLTFRSVTVGWQHACGITTAGAAYCWGFNLLGELGIGVTSANSLVPVLVSGGLQWVQLAASAHHTCGITVDKKAYCWGYNAVGQLGDGTTTNRSAPTQVAISGVNFTAIATNTGVGAASGAAQLARAHTCALSETGKPYCWGHNDRGQVGDGTMVDASSPVAVAGGLVLNGLALGEGFTCGMRGNSVWCWGWSDLGQLGNGTMFQSSSPVAVAGSNTFTSVSASGTGACGTVSSAPAGTTKTACWGTVGELGAGTAGLSSSPVIIPGSSAFTTVETFGNTCALSGAAAYCWGSNGSGEMGIGAASALLTWTPQAVTGGLSFSQITTGSNYACGVAAGSAYCWGSNFANQLGVVSTSNFPAPVAVTGGLTFASVSAGINHTCGVTVGGAAYCWGTGGNGQLGNGASSSATGPVAVSGGLTFASVTVGTSYSCGVTTSGAGYCWGLGIGGQLGTGSASSRTTPGLISGLTFSSISAGGAHACGVTTSGAGYCWGSNASVQLGVPSTTVSTTTATPVLVTGGLTFSKIDAAASGSGAHTCGVTTSGAGYCWGSNYYGQLGNGVAPAAPTRVTGY